MHRIIISINIADEKSFYLFDHTTTNAKVKIPHTDVANYIIEGAVTKSTNNAFFAAAQEASRAIEMWKVSPSPAKNHNQATNFDVYLLRFIQNSDYMVAAGIKKLALFTFAVNQDTPEEITVPNINNAITGLTSYGGGGILAVASQKDNKIFTYNFVFATNCNTDVCKTCGFLDHATNDCFVCKKPDRVIKKANSADYAGSCVCNTALLLKELENGSGFCECQSDYYRKDTNACQVCDSRKNFEIKEVPGFDHVNNLIGASPLQTCECKARTYLSGDSCVYCNPRHQYEDENGANTDNSVAQERDNLKYVENGECVCNDKHYPISPTLCRLCDDSQNFEIVGEKCVCTEGYYLLGDKCVQCPGSCAACTAGDIYSCTKCASGVTYSFLANKTCIRCSEDTYHLWCASNISTTLVTKKMDVKGGYIDLKMNVSLSKKISWLKRRRIDFSKLYVVSTHNQSKIAYEDRSPSEYNGKQIIPIKTNNDYLDVYYRIRLDDKFSLDDVEKLYIWPAYRLLNDKPGYQMVMTTLEVEVDSFGSSEINKFGKNSFYKRASDVVQVGISAMLVPALASALANGGVSSFLT